MYNNNHSAQDLPNTYPSRPRGSPTAEEGAQPPREDLAHSPEQEREQEHTAHPQEALPTLEESFTAIDRFKEEWDRQGNEFRRGLSLPPMTPEQAGQVRRTATGQTLGLNEHLFSHADVDIVTARQVSERHIRKEMKRIRSGESEDEVVRGELRQPTKKTRVHNTEGEASTGTSTLSATPNPMQTPGMRSRREVSASRSHAMPKEDQQQYSPVALPQASSKPSIAQGGTQPYSTTQPHDQAHLASSIHLTSSTQAGDTYEGPRSTAHQWVSPTADQYHEETPRPSQVYTAAGPPQGSSGLPQMHSGQALTIPLVNGRYQMTAWGRLNQLAAVHVAATEPYPDQGGYGEASLPASPSFGVKRPRPNTNKAFPLMGFMIRAQSGLDRAELYRALYPSILALLKLKAEKGDQDNQIWVQLKDYRYLEARDRLKEPFKAIQQDSAAQTEDFDAFIPSHQGVGDGWFDYVEDWDMPFRGLQSSVERERWLEYYWNSEQRDIEKQTVAPLDFDHLFSASHKAGYYYRRDVRKWELGVKVLVRLEGDRLIIVDMQ
jgi:hypothetical protein